jgi:hypothetical protein
MENIYVTQKALPELLLQIYPKFPKPGTNQHVSQWVNVSNNCVTSIQWNVIQ